MWEVGTHAAVQLSGSILVFLVTLYYALATWRLVHTPHLAPVRPIAVHRKSPMGWVSCLKNYGLGPDLGVEGVSLNKEEAAGDSLEKVFRISVIPIHGAHIEAELPTLSFRMSQDSDGTPLLFSWTTLTRKRRGAAWVFRPSTPGQGSSNRKALDSLRRLGSPHSQPVHGGQNRTGSSRRGFSRRQRRGAACRARSVIRRSESGMLL